MNIVIYLSFDGNCKEAFEYYQSILGGELWFQKYSDAPDDSDTPEELRNRLMHAQLISGDATLMGADMPGGKTANYQGFCASLHTDNPDEAVQIFTKLAEGGQITMPIGKTFWAEKFGMLIDKFGIPWIINCSCLIED